MRWRGSGSPRASASTPGRPSLPLSWRCFGGCCRRRGSRSSQDRGQDRAGEVQDRRSPIWCDGSASARVFMSSLTGVQPCARALTSRRMARLGCWRPTAQNAKPVALASWRPPSPGGFSILEMTGAEVSNGSRSQQCSAWLWRSPVTLIGASGRSAAGAEEVNPRRRAWRAWLLAWWCGGGGVRQCLAAWVRVLGCRGCWECWGCWLLRPAPIVCQWKRAAGTCGMRDGMPLSGRTQPRMDAFN